jgi:hypothetical protein
MAGRLAFVTPPSSKKARRDLVDLLLLEISETQIQLGGIQLVYRC